MFKHICKFCGKEYESVRKNSNYCSNLCTTKAYMNKHEIKKVCIKCGKEFYTSFKRVKFCSRKCATEYKRSIHPKKFYTYVCDYCNKEYKTDIKSKQKHTFCSHKCYSNWLKTNSCRIIKDRKTTATCPICGKEFALIKYKDGRWDTSLCCSSKCSHILAKINLNKNYKEKTGYDYPGQNPEVKNKAKVTWSKKSDEEIQNWKEKIANSWKNKSSDEIDKIVNKRQISFENNNMNFVEASDSKKQLLSSKEEQKIYKILLTKFPNAKNQYKTREYPFYCDFYLPEIDTYIEYQGYPFHGKLSNIILGPYDETNKDHKLFLESLQKDECNDWNRRFIKIWTIKDPKKRKIAKENNLNWLEFFTIDEFIEWFDKQDNYSSK